MKKHNRATVADLLALKGKRQLTMLRVTSLEEAEAAERAGIDMVSVPPALLGPAFREAAPTPFAIPGLEYGDLVTADVEKELKREIQYQLWMTLPPEQRRKRKPASADGKPAAEGDQAQAAADKPADAGKTGDEKARDAAEEAAKTNMAGGGKDDDVVRMEVAETLGNGVVRVVGQKRVIYRGVARVVEVMALVNNKDVDEKGRVKSSSFLDMKTQVIQ